MKKGVSILIVPLAVALAFTAGCGSSSPSSANSGTVVSSVDAETKTDETPGEGKSDAAEPEKETEKNNGKVTVEEQVVIDQDGFVATLTGIEEDSFWGQELEFLVENNTDKNCGFSVRYMSINGIMFDPFFASEIAAGKKANESISLFSSQLKAAGVTTIQEAEITFAVYDSETYEDIFVTDPIIIQTSAYGTFEQEYNDAGTELYHADGIRIVTQELDDKDSFWGADIYMYIENNTDQLITVTSRDVSVNGFMVDPSLYVDITPGKKAFTTLTFYESDLEKNKIEKISELEISFHVFDSETYDTIVDTDPITVSFE